MDEEAVVHIHSGILLSHKKEHIWVSSNEVDESGVYYKEKNKYRILMYIYGFYKDGTDEPIYRATMEMQT